MLAASHKKAQKPLTSCSILLQGSLLSQSNDKAAEPGSIVRAAFGRFYKMA
jgi:hypothetical protein